MDSEQVKQKLMESLGTAVLSPHFIRLANWDPEYMDRYNSFVVEGTEVRKGAIPRKYRELIAVAVCASMLNRGGTKVHITAALNNGATPKEVLETLQLATPPSGVIAVLYGSEVLEEVLKEKGLEFH